MTNDDPDEEPASWLLMVNAWRGEVDLDRLRESDTVSHGRACPLSCKRRRDIHSRPIPSRLDLSVSNDSPPANPIPERAQGFDPARALFRLNAGKEDDDEDEKSRTQGGS